MNQQTVRVAILACAFACEASLVAEHRTLQSRHPDLAFAADMAESAEKWSGRAFDLASDLSL